MRERFHEEWFFNAAEVSANLTDAVLSRDTIKVLVIAANQEVFRPHEVAQHLYSGLTRAEDSDKPAWSLSLHALLDDLAEHVLADDEHEAIDIVRLHLGVDEFLSSS